MDIRKRDISVASAMLNLLAYLSFDRKTYSKTYLSTYFLVFAAVFLAALCMLNVNYDKQFVYAHSLFGGSTGNGTQVQQNGNFVVDLYVNPQNPLIHKNTNIFLRFTSKAGDELMELPVSINLLKDGQSIKNANNYAVVQRGHYAFNYTFTEPGKYLLYVNVKDIYYTQNVLSFIFAINVDVSIPEKIIGFLVYFGSSYYYYYVPIGVVIVIAVVVKLYKKKMTTLKESKV